MLAECDHPGDFALAGEMFDPALAGYWGVSDFEGAMALVLSVIENNVDKVDGIKISLLDKEKEMIICWRRRAA